MSTDAALPDLEIAKRQLIQICDDPHVRGAARLVCVLVSELNSVSKTFRQIILEKEEYTKKYIKLSEEFKRLQSIRDKNESLPENKYIDVNLDLKKDTIKLQYSPINEQTEISSVLKESPKTCPLDDNEDFTDVIQETVLNISLSPILLKSKTKISKTNSSSNVLESPNKESKMINKENSRSEDKSFINLSNTFSLSSSENDVLNQNVTPISSNLKKMTKKSSTSKNKKSLLNLKQSRINFKNNKIKASLDITQTNNYFGGVRNSNSDDISNNKSDQSKQLQEKSQKHCGTSEESPSCIFLKQRKIHEHKFPEFLSTHKSEKDQCDDVTISIKSHKKSKIHIKPVDFIPVNIIKPEIQNSSENLETLLSTFKSEKKKFTGDENDETILIASPNINQDHQNSFSTINLKKSFTVSNLSECQEPCSSLEFPVVNPKVNSSLKVQIWSCKKCKDFYSIAFKNNKKMLREKMDDCYNKHRNRFNSGRRNTPPGFWEVNMPQTEIDSENN